MENLKPLVISRSGVKPDALHGETVIITGAGQITDGQVPGKHGKTSRTEKCKPIKKKGINYVSRANQNPYRR